MGPQGAEHMVTSSLAPCGPRSHLARVPRALHFEHAATLAPHPTDIPGVGSGVCCGADRPGSLGLGLFWETGNIFLFGSLGVS